MQKKIYNHKEMNREEKIAKLIETARSCVGMPYEYGAYLKTGNGEKPAGFDCSSFIQYLFGQAGVDLPRSSILQASSPLGIEISPDKIEPGDVLFFEGTKGHYAHLQFPAGKRIYIGHNAIYTGNDHIIHATENGKFNPILNGVVENHIDILPKEYYGIVLAKRFI